MNDRIEKLREKFLGQPEAKDPEKDQIAALINQGYVVEVVNPYGRNFNQKYRVVQKIGESKIVVVDDNGKVIGLQG